jgi:PAS domain S-box-containing protein
VTADTTATERLRILLVEDNPADAELVERELRHEGVAFESRLVDEEDAFLAALEEQVPDIVLSDYSMPRFDGLRALELLRQRRPETPLIFVTGSLNEETAVRCLKAGAVDYVMKEHLGRLGPALRSALDRRRQEEQLRLLWRAFEQGPVAVAITDANGDIVLVNPHFERVTGYSATEVMGRNPRLLKSSLTPPETYRQLWATLTTGGTWQGEFCNRRKDGSLFWEEAVISAMRDTSGRVTHYVAVKEDITGRRQAQEQLRQAELQLLQAQKMEAVGRLAGGIAHDFNNLLSVIAGQGERLLAAVGEGDPSRSRVEQICWSAKRAADLTRQLLAFGRRQVLEPRVLRLDAVVEEARGMLERVIGEDIDLVVKAPPRLSHVRADPGQIVQVLLNLVVNARDAMPRGGGLTIELDDAQLDERYAALHPPLAPGRYVLLAVTDTGEGMDEATRSRIFEPFFTTKEAGQGTGLGLSTVYGIVKQSGGFIWVYSEVGHGTAFKIYLPRVDEQPDARPEPPAEPPRTTAPRPGVRVLLVEDDTGVRGLMAELLDSAGYAVRSTGRPSEALALAEESPIDLLITDVIMPEMSGRELAQRLAERQPGLPVLYVSGYAGEAIARHGGLGPGAWFLQKPFGEADLLRLAAEALSAAAPKEQRPS